VTTYAQLSGVIEELRLGCGGLVTPGGRAGICTVHQIDLAVLALGLNAYGLSVFLVHHQTPSATLSEIVASEDACLLATDQAWNDPGWTELEIATPHHLLEVKLFRRTSPPQRSERRENPAVHIYTSGTEGASKGVIREQSRLVHEIELLASMLQMPKSSCVLCPVPLTSSYAFTVGLLHTLACGGTLVLERPLSGKQLQNAAATHRPWMLVGVPNLYDLWTRGIAAAPALQPDVLRHCVSAGSPLPQRVREKFEQLWGRDVSRHYGSTECGLITWELQRSALPASVGKPIAGVRISIIPPGASEGEAVVFTPYCALGYVDGTPLRHAPLAGLTGAVRTGDLGRLSDTGELEILGRVKEQINVHGLKVDPTEVENLIATDPRVADVAVVGIDTVQNDQWIAACIVCRETIADGEIRATYERILPRYKHPQRILHTEAIPRTPSGKIQRSKLAAMVKHQIETAGLSPQTES
jgi:acyl-CoA synthetase (AMP-forming)/AMP-acid ligase II